MISAILDWLADTMLWTGLLIAIVLLVRRPVARRFGPGIAYALWALPLARLLLPPVTLPGWLAPAATPLPLAFAPALAGPMAPPPPMALPAPMAMPITAPEAGSSSLVMILLALWAAGAVAFVALRVVTYRRMRRTLLAQALPVGELGRVQLVETPAIHGPVAFGVLDKVVALPVGFMTQPDRQARDFAIAHELSHHQAHDLLANMAAQLVLALHWCNPLAWYGWHAMRQDQEAACDARVMAGRGRAERACYAALIVGIATGQRTASPRGMPTALACPIVGPVLGEASIVQRLRSLTRAEVSRRQRAVGRLLVGASALALPLTASISFAAVQDVAGPPAPPVVVVRSQPGLPVPVQSIDPDMTPEAQILVTGHPDVSAEDAAAWAAFGARMEAFGRDMAMHNAATAADTAAIERDATALAAEVEQQFAEGGALHAAIMRQTEAATTLAMVEACAAQASMAGGSATCAGPGPAGSAAASAAATAQANIEANVMRSVARSLSGARASIARNMQLSAEMRAEVLSELDAEIADLQAGK